MRNRLSMVGRRHERAARSWRLSHTLERLETRVMLAADLSVSLTAMPNDVVLGEGVPIAATVTNHGLSAAVNVVLTDIVPPNTAYLVLPPLVGTVSNLNSTVMLSLPQLDAGASATLNLLVYPNLGPSIDSAMVTSDTDDPNPANNSGSITISAVLPPTPVLTSAILGATSISVAGTLQGRPDQTYQISFYERPNATPPEPFFLVLPVSTATVKTNASGFATIRADVPLTPNFGSYLFATSSGPTIIRSDYSSPRKVSSLSDLSVSILPPGLVARGTVLDGSITFVLNNTGPSPATDVALTVTVPPALAYTVAPVSAGSVSFQAGLIRLSIPRLDVGQSVLLTVVTPPSDAGNVPVSAAVMSGVSDPNPSNNSSIGILSVPPTSTLPGGPVVVRLQRVGFHRQPTRIVMTFNEALDPASARDLANYQILVPGRDGRLGTKDDDLVPIEAATYNEGAYSVTLTTRHPIKLHRRYELVAGSRPGSLIDASGRWLNSTANHPLGSPYRAIVRGFRLSAH